MRKRRIRTKDQLPRALTREEKIAAKEAKARCVVGIDVGSDDRTTVVVMRDMQIDGRTFQRGDMLLIGQDVYRAMLEHRNGDVVELAVPSPEEPIGAFHGIPVRVDPNMSDDMVALVNSAYDFRRQG